MPAGSFLEIAKSLTGELIKLKGATEWKCLKETNKMMIIR